MINLASQILGYSFTPPPTYPSIYRQDAWTISWYHKTGGLKKIIELGGNKGVVVSCDFELNDYLCGAGSISLAEYNFPIDAGDIVVIKFNGVEKYLGLVDSIPIYSKDKIKLTPRKQIFDEILVNYVYSGKPISYILQDIITNIFTYTGVKYSSYFIDLPDNPVISLDYSAYEKPKKIIDELIKKLDNRAWGINAQDFFVVYPQKQTVTKKIITFSNGDFSGVDYEKDFSGVEATRSIVSKKDAGGGGKTVYIGQVGFGGTYPILDIEETVRTKINKYIVSQYITDDNEALNLAYNNLVAKAKANETIGIKDLNYYNYFPTIADLITVVDKRDFYLNDLIYCDNITNDDSGLNTTGSWLVGSIDTTQTIDGSGSVKLSTGGCLYDFGNMARLHLCDKICFMIMADVSGSFLNFSFGDCYSEDADGSYSSGVYSSGLYSEGEIAGTNELYKNFNKTITIYAADTWQLVEIDIPKEYLTGDKLHLLLFSLTFTGAFCNVYIDRVQAFFGVEKTYTESIKKINFKLDKEDFKCNIELKEYSLQLNSLLFNLNKRIEAIESISEGV